MTMMTAILTVADGVDLVDAVAVHELVEGGVERAEHLEEVLRPHLVVIINIILFLLLCSGNSSSNSIGIIIVIIATTSATTRCGALAVDDMLVKLTMSAKRMVTLSCASAATASPSLSLSATCCGNICAGRRRARARTHNEGHGLGRPLAAG